MRQIQIGAWLFSVSFATAACSGQEFAPNEQGSTDDSSPSGNHGGSAGRSSAGSSTTTSSGSPSSAGKPSGGHSSAGNATAGTPPAAGATGNGSGGGNDEDCAPGSVTFKMLPGPDLPEGYLCNAGCGTGWLTITDAAGATAFSIFSACGTASCESCEPVPCLAGVCLPTPLGAEGSDLTWTGTYLAQGSCGYNMACQRQTCMPAGRYKAKACAAVSAGSSMGGGCMPKEDESLCAEAEFDFPTETEVKLILVK